MDEPTHTKAPAVPAGVAETTSPPPQAKALKGSVAKGSTPGASLRPKVAAAPPQRRQLRATLPKPEVILLSFFDGIGVAAAALGDHATVALTMAWEIDEGAVRISRDRSTGTFRCRGNIKDEDPECVAKAIDSFDPDRRMQVIIAAGPPCPDFSTIIEGEGRDGSHGKLFAYFCDLYQQLRVKLRDRRVGILVENVIMASKADQDYFSKRLGVEPVLVDAADFGVVSRPRVWWTPVDWTQCTGLRWSKVGRLKRLHVDCQRDDLTRYDMDGHSFSDEVQSGRKVLPCYTTPAPTDAGRPAPKSCKSKIDSATRQRWLESGRVFAPWHYNEYALLRSSNGALVTAPITIKEQSHHLAAGWTSSEGCSSRDRHRYLGNHRGVASFLFKLILTHGTVVGGQCDVAPVALSSSVPSAEGISSCALPSEPSGSARQSVPQWTKVLSDARALGLPITRERAPTSCGMPPSANMWEHWEHSQHMCHHAAQPPSLEPGLLITLRRAAQMNPRELRDHRSVVLQGTRSMIAELRVETDAWFAAVRPHVRQAYTHPDGHRFEVLVFLRLLRECGYPDIEALELDLTRGFPLLGPVAHSPGWRPRLDDAYRHPISLEAFRGLNSAYVKEKLRKPRVDPEWRAMMTEVVTEVQLGRMEGPFQAPEDWPKSTVGAASWGVDVAPIPDGPCFVARFQRGADRVGWPQKGSQV